jgi:hypothetical protein
MIRNEPARLGTIYNTGLPVIGSIDTTNPLQLLLLAAIGAGVLMPKKPESKLLFGGAGLALYYALSKVSL